MSTDQPAASPYVLSQDERTLACISHLTVFVSSIGFLVAVGLWIYLHINRKHPYAAFQAAQAVFFQLIVMILTFIVIGLAMLVMFGFLGIGLAAGSSGAGEAVFGIAMLLGFMIFIAMIVVLAMAMYGYAIFAAVRSYQGRPFRIPGISALAEMISPMPNVRYEPERSQP